MHRVHRCAVHTAMHGVHGCAQLCIGCIGAQCIQLCMGCMGVPSYAWIFVWPHAVTPATDSPVTVAAHCAVHPALDSSDNRGEDVGHGVQKEKGSLLRMYRGISGLVDLGRGDKED